jgi:hypothetical protein
MSIKCLFGFHKFNYFNKTLTDCFRECEACGLLEKYSDYVTDWYQYDKELFKIIYENDDENILKL